MQRLALALIFAVVAVAAVAVAVRAARAGLVAADGALSKQSGGDIVQKLAFFLLMGLILYVSVLGGA
jgi:hypothetical protein